MPQIWATYQELADCFGMSLEASRDAVIEHEFARRKCSDGLTRVKLPMQIAVQLIRRMPEFNGADASADDRFDRAIIELHDIQHTQSGHDQHDKILSQKSLPNSTDLIWRRRA